MTSSPKPSVVTTSPMLSVQAAAAMLATIISTPVTSIGRLAVFSLRSSDISGSSAPTGRHCKNASQWPIIWFSDVLSGDRGNNFGGDFCPLARPVPDSLVPWAPGRCAGDGAGTSRRPSRSAGASTRQPPESRHFCRLVSGGAVSWGPLLTSFAPGGGSTSQTGFRACSGRSRAVVSYTS
jgi:hypothetical protein